jgi:di/tricarboxylate transporter
MDIEKIQNIAKVILLFLGPIISIFLFLCAIEYPNNKILFTLDEEEFNGRKQLIITKKIIFLLTGILIATASFLFLFDFISITALGISMCSIILFYTISDTIISNKYLP